MKLLLLNTIIDISGDGVGTVRVEIRETPSEVRLTSRDVTVMVPMTDFCALVKTALVSTPLTHEDPRVGLMAKLRDLRVVTASGDTRLLFGSSIPPLQVAEAFPSALMPDLLRRKGDRLAVSAIAGGQAVDGDAGELHAAAAVLMDLDQERLGRLVTGVASRLKKGGA